MRRLGISIYPEKSDKQTICNYIDQAAKAGFSRIFSCLLSVTKSKEEIKAEFKEINDYAHKHGFEVIVDVSPRVFDSLGISYKDLTFFKDINADGFRLDLGFTGSEESIMTFNPEGLVVEINMSNDVHTIDTIMDYQPNTYKLYGCHNFYPHRYTGLSIDFFRKCSERFKAHGLNTAAFITSQNTGTFGPWAVEEGLPTLELHRNLPIDLQVKHLIALGCVDDFIISNCYPTQEELDSIASLDLSLVTFDATVEKGASDVERSIMFDELHFNRGDISEYVIRSTQSRVKYKEHYFEVFNTPKIIKRGDIVIESSEHGHYAGEMQIALKDMENSGKSNVVGHIKEDELMLLDYIKPWQKFRIREA